MTKPQHKAIRRQPNFYFASPVVANRAQGRLRLEALYVVLLTALDQQLDLLTFAFHRPDRQLMLSLIYYSIQGA